MTRTPLEISHLQCDNVKGWLSVKDHETALICARVLVEALECVVNNNQEQPDPPSSADLEADQAWASQPTEYDPS